MDAKRSPSSLHVASVEKAFRLLSAFDRQRSELTLSELAQATKMSVPNVQRLTATLQALGLLERNIATKRFALTPRTLDIGYRYLQASPLLETAAPYLAELNRRTEETVNMMVLDGTEIVYVARHRGFHSIGINLYIGARLPAFATSVGQAMLAFLPRGEAAARIDDSDRRSFTKNTTTDREALLRKLEIVRKQGYALEDQEMFLGGISIAAPILNQTGAPLAAINVAVPSSRFSAAQTERRFAALLLETARTISGPLAHGVRGDHPRPARRALRSILAG